MNTSLLKGKKKLAFYVFIGIDICSPVEFGLKKGQPRKNVKSNYIWMERLFY